MTSIPSMSSNFDFFNLFQDIDFFDSNIVHLDSKTRQFNEIANFLRNLQHCQFLYRYRKTNLLKFLLNCLNDSTFEWLKKRSHFDSLRIFSIVLTTAFSSQLKARAQKLAKRKARKIAERAELKTTKVAKSTSKLQNIDIFDSATCDESEFELYNEVANFLQNLQQCQHQYRKSDLLNLLSKCLCDLASEWFKLQSEFTSLKRFSTTLARAFPSAETSSRRASSESSNLQLRTLDVISESMKSASSQQATCVRVICKLCKQSFNFNRELYEHIRNHETLKFVKNSSLSINAVNLVCEIEKKSFVTHVSSASSAKSQKSIFESAITFEAITLLKRSNFSIFTLETIQKSMKIALFQTTEVTEVTCRHCDETFNFKKSLREHKREQHRRKFIESSFLSTNTLNSMCEDEKKSVLDDSFASSELQASIATSKQKFKSAITFEAVASLKNSHLSLSTLKTESESAKRSATCRHCKQTFKFKELLRKHKREQHAKKSVISSSLRSHAFKSVCKSEEKSAVKDVTTLSASHELRISDQKVDVQKHSFVNSLLLIDTIKSTCKVAEKSTTASIAKFSKSTSEERAESRTRTAYLFARLKASRLNLSLNTFVIILETMKNASIQEVACARAMCRSCKQNFNFNKKLFEHIREHEALKRINTVKSTCEAVKKSANACPSSSQKSSIFFATSRNLVTDTRISLQSVSSKDSNLSIATFKIRSERVKNASIQQVACARICKHCKQSFNFNNKLHEHIRQHHARKSVKSSDLRAFAFESTYKVIEKSAVFCSSASLTSQSASSTLSATSRSQIFSAKMSSRSVSFKSSHLSIATLKITSKSVKKLSANCSLTSSFSSPRISIQKHHEFHMQKSYLTMNDLSRMFDEKPKSFDLQQHQNCVLSSRCFDIRQSHSIKFYLTIENLFKMFDGKFRRKSLFQDQKNVSSSEFFSKQLRIIVYFKSAINQKSSINQNSKSSKSKSLNQHMSAKSIRIAFSKNSEKLIVLSYKSTNIFCVTSAETSALILVLLHLLSVFLLALAFVSAFSTTKMDCINVYEQAVSIIDRAIQ